MQIESEIARLQQDINSIRIDSAPRYRARLTVGQHINTAANSILTAIRNCQSARILLLSWRPQH